MTVVQLQPISVVFTAPEESVAEINKALANGDVPVDALTSDGTRTLSKGKLRCVNNEVDQASGTIRMKASFDNEDDALWPGLSVSTRLLLRTVKDAIIVPQDAIQHGPDGLFVYVVGQDNKAKKQDVKVSEQNSRRGAGDRGPVRRTEGRRHRPVARLQEGTLVKPTEPQASGDGRRPRGTMAEEAAGSAGANQEALTMADESPRSPSARTAASRRMTARR